MWAGQGSQLGGPQALQQLSSSGPQAAVELSLLVLLPRAERSQLPHSGLDLAPLALATQLPSSCTLGLCPFRMRGLSPPLAPAPAAVSTLGLCFHFN